MTTLAVIATPWLCIATMIPHMTKVLAAMVWVGMVWVAILLLAMVMFVILLVAMVVTTSICRLYRRWNLWGWQQALLKEIEIFLTGIFQFQFRLFVILIAHDVLYL